MAALILSKRLVTIIGIGVVVMVVGGRGYFDYQDWSKRRGVEMLEKEKAAVGANATFAATLIRAAQKDCGVLGLDIPTCATHSGPLIQDQTAPEVAKMAQEAHASYVKACQKHYDAEYCKNLLSRAWDIGRNEDAASAR